MYNIIWVLFWIFEKIHVKFYNIEPGYASFQNRGGQNENPVLGRFWEKNYSQNHPRTKSRTDSELARTTYSDPPYYLNTLHLGMFLHIALSPTMNILRLILYVVLHLCGGGYHKPQPLNWTMTMKALKTSFTPFTSIFWTIGSLQLKAMRSFPNSRTWTVVDYIISKLWSRCRVTPSAV